MRATDVSKRLTDLLLHADDFSSSIEQKLESLGRVLAFDAALCVYGGVRSGAALSTEASSVLLRWLDAGSDDLVALHRSVDLPEPLGTALQPYCGLLAMCIDRVNRGWIVLLRREQLHTVVWSGIPAKLQRIGPLGVRLTPQGSLA